MGGTFDHLHKGHTDFITFAGSLAKRVIIGVTDDTVVKGKQYSCSIQPYKIRMKKVIQFCKQRGLLCTVIPLHDQYGPTIESTDIVALAVTTATQKGGQQINHLRKRLKLPQLPIHIFQLTTGSDGHVITSTRIRSGDINRSGQFYGQLFADDLILNETQKKFFSMVQGKIITEPSDLSAHQKVVVVGDVSLQQFIEHNWHYDLGIFDNHTQRIKTIDTLKSFDTRLKNPAGIITTNLYNTIHSWKHSPFRHMLIDGEEDLATVAAVLAMPLGTIVYYGQPNQGMVTIEISEEIKERFFLALKT